MATFLKEMEDAIPWHELLNAHLASKGLVLKSGTIIDPPYLMPLLARKTKPHLHVP